MKKKIIKRKNNAFFVTDSYPHNNQGGGALTSLNIFKILNKIFNVYLIFIENKQEKNFNQKDKKLFKNIVILRHELDNENIFKTSDYIYGNKFKKKILDLSNSLKPKIVISYGYSAMEAISDVNEKIKFGTVGDPIYLPLKYRKNEILKQIKFSNLFNSSKFILKYLLVDYFVLLKLKIKINKLKKKFIHFGCFIHHHAKNDLQCDYIRTPLIQSKFKKIDKFKLQNKKLRLAHVGHLKGTVTINSFRNLVNIVVPKLINRIGKENLEIFVFGKFKETLSLEIKEKVKEQGVFKFLGHVKKNFNQELKKVDALVACNNINLGARIRILTAMSNMTQVITHKSNLDGTPEFISNQNCLVGRNFDEIVDLCLSLKKNIVKNKLIKKKAYITVSKYFSFESFENLIKKKFKLV